MSWDHFKDSGCMNSFDNLPPHEKKRYRSMGEKYMGYDKNRLDNKETILYNSTGDKVSTTSDFLISDIARSIKNGLEFDELSSDDVKTLKAYYGKDYKKNLYFYYKLYDISPNHTT